MKKYHLLLFFATFISCASQLGTSSEDFIEPEPIEIVLRKDVFIDKGVFQVSYNEEFQQPNWVEYVASNRAKNVSRGDLDFFLNPMCTQAIITITQTILGIEVIWLRLLLLQIPLKISKQPSPTSTALCNGIS